MRGDAAHESKPDPRRAPTPPVTTHRVQSEAPDPGTARGRLPPFRSGAAARPLPDHSAEGVGPTFAVSANPSADVLEARAADPAAARAWDDPTDPADEVDAILELEPVDAGAIEAALDVEPFDAEIDEGFEIEAEDVGEPHAVLEILAMDVADVDAGLDVEPIEAREANAVVDVASEDAGETDDLAQMPLGGDVAQSSAVPTLEASAEDEPNGVEELWDALGEALQVAVTRANPPFAEDLIRSADAGDGAVNEESYAPSTGSRIQQDEARRALSGRTEHAQALAPHDPRPGTAEAEVANRPAAPPSGAKPRRDGFTEDLAATLESLAGSLRARGFNALDDAFARGGRLEASLALFLAGYRAGRGE